MDRRDNWVAHQWKMLGCIGIISFIFGFTLTPAYSADREDEIAELKAEIEALQRRVEDLEAQQGKKETGSPEIEMQKDESLLPVLKGDFPGSYKRPDSDMSFKTGGYVKLTFYKDLDFMPSGDFFIITQIPVSGTPDSKKDGETRLNARETLEPAEQITGGVPVGSGVAGVDSGG